MRLRAITGSWLWTGESDEAPVRRGAVVFDEHGGVIAYGSLSELRGRFASLTFEEHRAVLMPGLVNAHTHLELSGLRGQVPGGQGFAPWVERLQTLRAQQGFEADPQAVAEAVSELLGAGVVAVADVCNRLHAMAALSDVPITAWVFHEVFGIPLHVAESALARADAEREACPELPAHMHYALAPHTSHTLHTDVLSQIVRRAADGGRRTSVHLAEHAAERAFLTTGQGPFADWVVKRAAGPLPWTPPGLDAIHYMDRLGLLGPHLIAVHLTDARPDELALLAERKAHAVLCPRSNLHIEVKLPPLLDILRAGIKPGLGTDSLASNSSLDPLAEARALHKRFPTVPAAQLLAMATSWGADALDLGARLGRVREGVYPGLIAFEHGHIEPADPLRFVLSAERAPRHMLLRPSYHRLPPCPPRPAP